MDRNLFFSSKDHTWETPKDFFDKLNKEFNFSLDPCCSKLTAKCKNYYTEQDNGLLKNWGGHTVYMNPPYGREQIKWIKKAFEESLKENTTVVCLIPARTDTKIWHEIIFPHAEIRFIKGRLKFGGSKSSAPFPSAIVIFRKNMKDKRILTYY